MFNLFQGLEQMEDWVQPKRFACVGALRFLGGDWAESTLMAVQGSCSYWQNFGPLGGGGVLGLKQLDPLLLVFQGTPKKGTKRVG